jgi:signal transduction histidine kinase
MTGKAEAPMDDPARLARLRHDLAGPLSAILAEVQLLMEEDGVPPAVMATLRLIEQEALRMRSMLRER